MAPSTSRPKPSPSGSASILAFALGEGKSRKRCATPSTSRDRTSVRRLSPQVTERTSIQKRKILSQANASPALAPLFDAFCWRREQAPALPIQIRSISPLQRSRIMVGHKVPSYRDACFTAARARALYTARGGFVVYMHNFVNILHKYANTRKKIDKWQI